MNTYGKRPRQYAAEIIALPTLEQRRKALALVPCDWRDWVKEYVVDYFGKQHFLTRYQQTRRTR
ncbi:MAG: hypothetical protein EPN17_00820 [Methylobacter sp.]|nr:MAG: hypothetical protein EPN17_00820 [Methylobacter sp.]